jgi:hypothetical protein
VHVLLYLLSSSLQKTVKKAILKLSTVRRKRGSVVSLSLKSLEQRKVLVCYSLVLPRFRKLESFRTLRKLLRSRRLLIRSLELKPELP